MLQLYNIVDEQLAISVFQLQYLPCMLSLEVDPSFVVSKRHSAIRLLQDTISWWLNNESELQIIHIYILLDVLYLESFAKYKHFVSVS